MLRYPADWLESLRAKADIVQVIGSYVNLKRNGSRYVGLCPFHNEKTGSFHVDAQKQLYHCFGCKAGGTVINFIMEMEHLSFPEAVAFLADRYGIPLPEMRNDPNYEKQRNERERLLLLNKEAAKQYHTLLWQPEGSEVLAYFRKRGLSDEVIRRFGLGASLRGVSIQEHLKNAGFTQEEMLQAGILVKRDNGTICDMFRGRAMFPIIDSYGNVLGFGGRALGDEQPKYLNTGDTLVFNKRKNVYAANLLRKCRHLARVVLVEGYMDVVSLNQFGIEGVAATLGTALTTEQAVLLKRFAPQIYLGYDGDGAGQHAILRGLDIMEEADIPVKVLDFPDQLDPDEFIRQRGAEAFAKLPAISGTAYRMRREKEKYDLSTQDGRTEYAKACAVFLQKVNQPVELENYLVQLAEETGFEKTILRQQVMSGISVDLSNKTMVVKQPQLLRKFDNGKESPSRIQQVLLSFIAAGFLPKDSLHTDELEGSLEKEFLLALQQGETAIDFMERQPDESSRHRSSEILSRVTTEDSDTSVQMAKQALASYQLQKLDSQINQADNHLSLDEAAKLLNQYSKLSDRPI